MDAVAALEARLVDRIVLPTSPDYNIARQESCPVADSAFIHRHVDADLVVDVLWTNDTERAQMEAWLDGFMNLVKPFLNGHMYQNYPDARLQDFAQAYWGPAYPQLQQIKAQCGPKKFFHFQQSVRLPNS